MLYIVLIITNNWYKPIIWKSDNLQLLRAVRHVSGTSPSSVSPGQWASARHQVPFPEQTRDFDHRTDRTECFIQCQVEWTWQVQKMNGVLIDLAVVLHQYPTWYPLVIKPSSGKSSIDYFLIFSHKILNFDCGFPVTFDFPPEGRRDRRWWGLPKHSVTPNPSGRHILSHFGIWGCLKLGYPQTWLFITWVWVNTYRIL